jgi:hypothetical protein
MKTKIGWIAASFVMFGGTAFAQDIAGDWQGTLKAGQQELRLIVHVEKGRSWGLEGLAGQHRPEPGLGRNGPGGFSDVDGIGRKVLCRCDPG